MSRSTKKGPYVLPSLYKKVEALNEAGKKSVVKTWSRSSTIFPEFVGHTFAVHDGRKHRARVRYRGHGWPQAGRVCTYPQVHRPRRR